MVDDMRFQRHRDAAGSGAAGRQEGKRKSLRRRWAHPTHVSALHVSF